MLRPWCFSGPRGDWAAAEMHLRMTSSSDKLNRIALSGHPCLTPEWMRMGGVLPVEMRTSVVAPVYTFVIMRTRSGGKPMCSRVVDRAL